jgi:hypothetical protein
MLDSLIYNCQQNGLRFTPCSTDILQLGHGRAGDRKHTFYLRVRRHSGTIVRVTRRTTSQVS